MADEKQVNSKVLIALLREGANKKAAVAELTGEFGERLRHHKEASNLNLKAFRIISTMNGMEELKRDAFWDALQLYYDMASTELWDAGHVGDLVKDAAAPVDEDAEAAERNAAAIRDGISELPADEAPTAPAPKRGRPKAGGNAPGTYRVN